MRWKALVTCAFAALLLLAPAADTSAQMGGGVSNPTVPARQKLTGARTYTVTSTGSNSNDCLTTPTACLTIQGAVNKALNTIDTQGNNVTINALFAGGPYTGVVTVNGPMVGGGILVIQGSVAGTALTVNSGSFAITALNGANVQLKNFTVTNSGAGGGVSSQFGSSLTLAVGMNYGTVGASQIDSRASIVVANAYTISGNGVSHMHADALGTIGADALVVTCTGSPAFSSYFIGVGSAYAELIGTTFSGCGSVTGPRHTVNRNGSIRTNTSNPLFFPGNSAGTVVSSGTLDNIVVQGPPPVLSACGTSPSIDANANSTIGTVTVGTTTGTCTATFAAAYASYVHCVVHSHTTLAAFGYSYSLTAVVVTATTLDGDVFDYACNGV